MLERRITERRRRDKWRTRLLVLWLTITTIFWVTAIVNLAHQGNDLDHVVDQQRNGRAVAIDALCGAVSGIVEAGRSTIVSGAAQDTKFTRRLEQLGYPRVAVRQAQAQVAAKGYARLITDAVERTTGSTHLARDDGTLDCSRIKSAAAVGHAPSP